MFDELLSRVQDKVDRVHRHNDPCGWPPLARPPVTAEAMATAEVELGFPLPLLLRALYLEVSDGNFGPGGGLLQLNGHPDTLVGLHTRRLRSNTGKRHTDWPAKHLAFIGWGCCYTSVLDCSDPRCPVYFDDSDLPEEFDTISDRLRLEAESLEEWLWRWVRDEDMWGHVSKIRWVKTTRPSWDEDPDE